MPLIPRTQSRRIVAAAAGSFLSSKILLLLMLIFGSQIAFLRKVYQGSIWETQTILQLKRLWPELQRMVMAGDSWWYARIAASGYDKTLATPTVAFFPLFPFTVRFIGPTGVFALDGIIVSAATLFGSLILLAAIGLRVGFEVDDVERAMFYLCFFPTAYFLSFPLTESLFLFLSLGAVLAGLTGRWWLAGPLAGLATLTRAPGVLLLLPLLLIFRSRSDRAAQLAWLLFVPAGLGAFMWKLHVWTGDWLAFTHAQVAWNRRVSWFFEPLTAYLGDVSAVAEPWSLTVLHFTAALLLLGAGTALTLTRQPRWLGLYTLASVLLPLSSNSLQSMARYAVVVFPLFLWLGYVGRRANVDRLILGVGAMLQGWLIAWVIMRVDFALA